MAMKFRNIVGYFGNRQYALFLLVQLKNFKHYGKFEQRANPIADYIVSPRLYNSFIVWPIPKCKKENTLGCHYLVELESWSKTAYH